MEAQFAVRLQAQVEAIRFGCSKSQLFEMLQIQMLLDIQLEFYGITFKVCREIAYAVQGQLYLLPQQRKKFITLSSREVYKNAWYTIHGISRLAYHKYKAAAFVGRINEMHRDSGITQPQPHTIQVETNFMTIIQENRDRMPNEFRNIERKRVNNLLVLPNALN